MLNKKLGLAILIPLVALMALTACTKNNDVGAQPAVLEGQSEHWKVKLEYKANGKNLKEIPTVTYLGNDKLTDAHLNIIYNNVEPEIISIESAPGMYSGSSITLTSAAEIKSWKDLKQVEIEGNIGERHFKEYVYPENKTSAAPAK